MHRVVFTKKYKKSLNKIIGSGDVDLADIESVIEKIASGHKLDARHKDHALTGNLSGFRECHIKNDLLLVYYIQHDELILVLVDVGSHSDLFR